MVAETARRVRHHVRHPHGHIRFDGDNELYRKYRVVQRKVPRAQIGARRPSRQNKSGRDRGRQIRRDVYENEQDSEAIKEKSQKKNPFTDNKIEKENVKAKDDTANSNVTYNLREFVLAKVRESEEKLMKEQQP